MRYTRNGRMRFLRIGVRLSRVHLTMEAIMMWGGILILFYMAGCGR